MKVYRQAAALFLCAGLLLSGCSSSSDERGDSTGPTLPARTVAEGKWQQGPPKPELHTPYPYDIYTHCGVKWVRFGGRWWVLDTVFPGTGQVKGEPPSRDSQRLAGYMTLIDANTADFDAAGMPTMQFVPAGRTPAACA